MSTIAEVKEVLKEYDDPKVWKSIQDDIEANRKGDFKVSFKNSKNKKVTIRQIKHKFHFGANLFLLEEMETKEKNQKFKENFKKVFNYATLPIYWCDLEPDKGLPRFAKDSKKVYRRPPMDLCIEFCLENNIEMKAHCLNYPSWSPKWATEGTREQYDNFMETRFAKLAQRYRYVIPAWEVINEVACNYQKFPEEYIHDTHYIEQSFKLAKKYFPNNELIINEASGFIYDKAIKGTSIYADQIAEGIKNGAEIDAIGMQSHMMWCQKEAYKPDVVRDSINYFASEFKKPVQITEVSFQSLFDGESDEEIQAETLEKLYSAWFSIKDMEAIVYWNLTDGYAYNAEPGDMTAGENLYGGALCRFDGSHKPAYDKLDELINVKWHTEFTKETNGEEISFRGFYGDYEIVVEEDGKEEVYQTAFYNEGDSISL